MKTTTRFLLIVMLSLEMVALALAVFSLLTKLTDKAEPATEQGHDTIEATARIDKDTDWDVFVSALMEIESGGSDSAVNSSTGAAGCLQITQTAVTEANRILGDEFFDMDDRFDRTASVAMFDVIQTHYNGGRDKHWALKLWNPRSDIRYHMAVMDKYNEMINEKRTENGEEH